MDIAQISAELALRAEALCRELLPAGRKDGNEWRVGSIAGEPGRNGGSLHVHLSGSKAGIWCDFACSDDAGDALDLVAAVKFAGDKGQACRWARAWLGLDPVNAKSFRSRKARPSRVVRDADEAEGAKRKRELAWQMWSQAAPGILETPVDFYLKERGLDLRALGRQPGALRHSAACLHRNAGKRYHAMLAAVVSPAGKFMACHRTYLASGQVTAGETFSQRWDKAPVEPAKLVLGATRGGAIHIWRGEAPDLRKMTGELVPGRRPSELTPAHAEAPGRHANNAITLTEGIEDALTVALADPMRRVWAAISISNMKNIRLHECFRSVTIVADNDARGSDADRALMRVIDRLQGDGRQVFIVRPPAGAKDVNELVRAG